MKILMFIVLGIFLFSLYIWIGRCIFSFFSLVVQKELWDLCRERGLFEEELSGKKLLPCKCVFCKIARSLGFDKITKQEIEDSSKYHPRWVKWLQIILISLWPITLAILIIAFVFGACKWLFLLPYQLIKDLREWWN